MSGTGFAVRCINDTRVTRNQRLDLSVIFKKPAIDVDSAIQPLYFVLGVGESRVVWCLLVHWALLHSSHLAAVYLLGGLTLAEAENVTTTRRETFLTHIQTEKKKRTRIKCNKIT